MAKQRGDDSPMSLLDAAAQGDATRVAEALQNGAAVDVRDERESTRGRTPLMLGAEAGHVDVVQALLAAGADVQATDDPDNKPPRGLGFILREAGLDALQDAKYTLNRTALMFAACSGHVPVIAELLKAGAKISQKDHAGCTALHLAAHHGHLEAVRALLAAGSKVDQRGPNRQSPASLAAERGAAEVVQALLAAGASVTQTDGNGRSVLDVAAAQGMADVVRAVLQSLSREPDHSEVLSRALTWAVRATRGATEESIVAVAEQLVAAGARVAKDANPAPLDTAADSGFERVVAILLAAGAEVNATDRSGHTALLGPVLYRHLGVAKLLLDHGADPNLRDEDGKSAVDYARERAKSPKTDAVYLLLKEHAGPSSGGKERKASGNGRKGRK
ncbi:MAG TPA: ankyrin repeat domain-containing protein [Pirellulales bacterium]|nr:ankyrin repeat domain-containing protein [Pirellulales bacterium]